MKSKIIKDIKDFLERKGYDFFEFIRGCFDIAAKRERLLLIKLLVNVDSYQESQARDLKILSKALSASPVILGKRTRRENLEKDTIYERFGLPTLHPETFKEVIEGNYPDKIRARGGLFGKINPKKLKRIRKERDLTQEKLAKEVGVSQKNISEHERDSGKANYSMIKLMERKFNRNIKEGIDPLKIEFKEVKSKEVGGEIGGIGKYMKKAGFKINYTGRAPPEIIARENTTLLSRFSESTKSMKRWEEHLSNFSKLSETPAFFVTEEGCESNELPVFSKEELNEVKQSEELIKMIKERVNFC